MVADVILIPEIPFDPENIAEAILDRSRSGKHFSIVAVSEGAMSVHDRKREKELLGEIKDAKDKKEKSALKRKRLRNFIQTKAGRPCASPRIWKS